MAGVTVVKFHFLSTACPAGDITRSMNACPSSACVPLVTRAIGYEASVFRSSGIAIVIRSGPRLA